jgi:hypothetical protein
LGLCLSQRTEPSGALGLRVFQTPAPLPSKSDTICRSFNTPLLCCNPDVLSAAFNLPLPLHCDITPGTPLLVTNGNFVVDTGSKHLLVEMRNKAFTTSGPGVLISRRRNSAYAYSMRCHCDTHGKSPFIRKNYCSNPYHLDACIQTKITRWWGKSPAFSCANFCSRADPSSRHQQAD